MFTIISKYIHLMLEVSCLLVAFNLAALSASAVANELTDVPQAWYSLDGSHVAFFQKDGDVWYAQISKCDGGEVLWGTDTDRPLCGCVSSDGKSIAVLTGVPDRPGSRYSELRITVITDEEVQFTRDLPGITVVESSGTQTDAVLALAEIDFRRDQPVVTLVSDGRVLRRVKVGEKSRGESVALPLTVYSADSTRTAIANATHFTWKLASLTQRPEISMSHVVAPLSTGMLATCILNARNFKDRKDAWKRLTAKLQIPSSSNYEADDWLFGMKATGCFGWQAVGDVVAPEISDLNVRHKKFVLTESPSRFWLRVISIKRETPVVSRTLVNLATAREPEQEAIDGFAQLPSVRVRRFQSPRNQIGLRNTLTFSAEWAYPFNAAGVVDGPFVPTLSTGSNLPSVPVKFMKGAVEFCRSAQSGGWRMARIPLMEGYSVLYLLSGTAKEFREIDDALFAGRLPEMLTKASWKEVKLDCRIPILALSRKLEVREGLSCLVEQNGQFDSGLNAGSHLTLIEASQSVLLQIDEDGVSAAPSTTYSVSSISPGESLTVDRPFHVCVLADGSDFPIIVARVISPEVIGR